MGKSFCKLCGEKFPTETMILFHGKKYCSSCIETAKSDYEIKLQEVTERRQQREKELENDYQKLIDYICEQYELDVPTGLILGQIANYKKNFGYEYRWMGNALWYAHEIKGMTFIEKYGVALIKMFYDEAKDYTENLEKQQERLENKLKEQLENKHESEIIKTKVIHKLSSTSNRKQKRVNLIDINSLIGGDES